MLHEGELLTYVAFHVCYDHYEHTIDLHIFAGVHQTLENTSLV